MSLILSKAQEERLTDSYKVPQWVDNDQLNSVSLGVTYLSFENLKQHTVYTFEFSVSVFVSFPIQFHSFQPSALGWDLQEGLVLLTLGFQARNSEWLISGTVIYGGSLFPGCCILSCCLMGTIRMTLATCSPPTLFPFLQAMHTRKELGREGQIWMGQKTRRGWTHLGLRRENAKCSPIQVTVLALAVLAFTMMRVCMVSPSSCVQL